MSETVAIVGSRRYPSLSRVEDAIIEAARSTWLASGVLVVTGDASGVDEVVARTARALKLPLRIYAADWKTYGKAAGPIRNTELAKACDRLIAWWDGHSRGTLDTVSKARRLGKHVRVFGPAGREVHA